MLASITPLGERARGSRWGLTVGFYVAGSTLAGAAAGAAAGELGRLIWGRAGAIDARAWALAAALAAGLALDPGRRVPPLPPPGEQGRLGEEPRRGLGACFRRPPRGGGAPI